MAHLSELDRNHRPRAVDHPGGAGALSRSAAGIYGRRVKRVLDLLAVLALAPFVLPLVGLFAVLIRLDGGPAFYSQDRVGRNGRVFRFWKLRSMIVDAEDWLEAHLAADPAARAEWETHQKLRDDPRVTPVGQFLRRTSLDELPQLWNVFKGDMSLVGPRPMMPAQRKLYPGQAYFALRPGLTGFWQIRERNGVSFADRAIYDTLYADRLSLVTDLMVILKTLWVVVRGTGR